MEIEFWWDGVGWVMEIVPHGTCVFSHNRTFWEALAEMIRFSLDEEID